MDSEFFPCSSKLSEAIVIFLTQVYYLWIVGMNVSTFPCIFNSTMHISFDISSNSPNSPRFRTKTGKPQLGVLYSAVGSPVCLLLCISLYIVVVFPSSKQYQYSVNCSKECMTD